MYDLVPPNMKAQFNLINKPNQSIKLLVNIADQVSSKKDLVDYKYNKKVIFKYSLIIKNSQYHLNIYSQNTSKNHFKKTILGSFIYDKSIKYSISNIVINAKSKNDLDPIIYGFFQKDFTYSIYKNSSLLTKYKTTFKLQKDYQSLLKSINFLKELVTEPSNIIYPNSFSKRTQSQVNRKTVNISTLNKKKLMKIGMNCLLAVSQGSKREPVVMEFKKKNSKKNVDILFVGKGVCFDSGGISIKPSGGMEDMKWDMAGAAVTVSIIKYLSEIKTNFSNGMPIPKEHACKKKGGKDLSIPVEFINIPENTKSFALIIDDPDAIPVAGKISVHWVVIDIPPSNTKLDPIKKGKLDFGLITPTAVPYVSVINSST